MAGDEGFERMMESHLAAVAQSVRGALDDGGQARPASPGAAA